MPSPGNAQLAAALERVHQAAQDAVIQTHEMSRPDRELLLAKGWLQEIIRGWYLLTTPDAKMGDTALWQSSFWAFLAAYLRARFKERYCLSAESSLDLHTGKMGTPKQVVVWAETGGNSKVALPSGASIFMHGNADRLPPATEVVNGVRVFPLALSLARTTPTFFRLDPLTAEIALKMVRRDELARALLTEWNAAAAGRLIGALSEVGRNADAKSITADLEAAGYKFSPENPFEQPPVLGSMTKVEWPHVGRIVALWQKMREPLLAVRPKPPKAPPSLEIYLKQANGAYARDAYNSLSIEGYRVTPELIARVATGEWDTSVARDRKEADAMAARGYYEAHKKVLESISRTFRGENAGVTLDRDLADWYRALFSPSVQAGILEPGQLAGYRERAVYITKSSHVPPQKDAVPACMEIYFRLLKEESDEWVRAILGHFIFVYIHPYSDGNGRLGRFIMNLMLASGGYPWTVIRNERREAYMAALEEASMNHAIESLSKFVAEEMAMPAEE
jgi:hypothetical protein